MTRQGAPPSYNFRLGHRCPVVLKGRINSNQKLSKNLFLINCFISFINGKRKMSSEFFLKNWDSSMQVEQPLRGMELREKEAQKD